MDELTALIDARIYAVLQAFVNELDRGLEALPEAGDDRSDGCPDLAGREA
jgi:hypothetical protein